MPTGEAGAGGRRAGRGTWWSLGKSGLPGRCPARLFLLSSMHELVFESPASTVYRTVQADGTVLAVKVGSCAPEHTPEPHDIGKEARILARLAPLRHPNVRHPPDVIFPS
jgi:hypothetical protein